MSALEVNISLHQVQVLEKETSLLKEKLHNEEERREKIKDAYETQVREVLLNCYLFCL